MNKQATALIGGLILTGLATAAAAAPGFSLERKLTFGGGDGILAAGGRPYLSSSGSTQRGMAYNPVTNHLYVVNRAGSQSIQILDATTGADVGTLSLNGVVGGFFGLNTIGVGDDGVIYAANLITNNASLDPVKIYRYANESSAPTVAFIGAPRGASGAGFGHSIDVRGSGASTQIVLGGDTGTGPGGIEYNSYAVFTTANGTNFTGQGMTIAGPASNAFQNGIAFGAGNTVYGRYSFDTALEGTTFDLPGAATRNAGAPYALTTEGEVPIGIDEVNALLATVDGDTSAVRLYDISSTTGNPVLLDTETFPFSSNANVNRFGAVAFGNGMLWVLNTNNGLQAFNVVPEPASMGLVALAGAALLGRRRR